MKRKTKPENGEIIYEEVELLDVPGYSVVLIDNVKIEYTCNGGEIDNIKSDTIIVGENPEPLPEFMRSSMENWLKKNDDDICELCFDEEFEKAKLSFYDV